MAKKRDKKLDLILAEIAKLRTEVRALAKMREAATKPKTPKASVKPQRKAAAKTRKPAAATSPRKASAPHKRPVLVAGSDAPEPTTRTGT